MEEYGVAEIGGEERGRRGKREGKEKGIWKGGEGAVMGCGGAMSEKMGEEDMGMQYT